MKKINLDTFLPAGLLSGYKKIGEQLKENSKQAKALADEMINLLKAVTDVDGKVSDSAKAQKVASDKNVESIKKISTLQQQRIKLEQQKTAAIQKAIIVNSDAQRKNLKLIQIANNASKKTRDDIKTELRLRRPKKGALIN